MKDYPKAKVDLEELKSFAENFGRVVKKARHMVGMSQRECAYQLGVPRTVLGNIEQGHATYVPLIRALKLCRLLGVKVDELGNEEEDIGREAVT